MANPETSVRVTVQTSTTDAVLTVPTGYIFQIVRFEVMNGTTTAATDVDVHYVKSGGSVSDSNKLGFSGKTIQGGSAAYPNHPGHNLEAGDSIFVLYGAGAAQLNVAISGNLIEVESDAAASLTTLTTF